MSILYRCERTRNDLFVLSERFNASRRFGHVGELVEETGLTVLFDDNREMLGFSRVKTLSQSVASLSSEEIINRLKRAAKSGEESQGRTTTAPLLSSKWRNEPPVAVSCMAACPFIG